MRNVFIFSIVSGRADAINVSVRCENASEKAPLKIRAAKLHTAIIHYSIFNLHSRKLCFCTLGFPFEGKLSPKVTEEV